MARSVDEEEVDQLSNAVRWVFLARTRRGRIFKASVFWITLATMFVIPLGPVVLYYMWKHGKNIDTENASTEEETTS